MESTTGPDKGGFWTLVGGTPLVRLNSLSEMTGCDIYGKCEFQAPGGSVKDRAAKYLVEGFEKKGLLKSGESCLVEATAGNTGVSLAMIALQRKYKCIFCYPESISIEKVQILKTLGAEVISCPLVPGSDPRHFQATAKRIAQERPNAIYVGQFDNLDNARGHFETTGPEIWEQTKGKVDGFVSATGTGGTLAGTSQYLKMRKPLCQVYTMDTPGQGIVFENKGVRDRLEHEKTKDSVVAEGIGSGKLYDNLRAAAPHVDGMFQYDDDTTVSCAHFILQSEGIFIGGSAATNVIGAFLLAKKLGPGKTIVTILCDGGQRYASKLFNDHWLAEKGFTARCGVPIASNLFDLVLRQNGL